MPFFNNILKKKYILYKSLELKKRILNIIENATLYLLQIVLVDV